MLSKIFGRTKKHHSQLTVVERAKESGNPFTDTFILDRIIEIVAYSIPIQGWPNLALVCKDWSDSCKRVFPKLRETITLDFDEEHSHKHIKISKGTTNAQVVLTKTEQGAYTWSFSKPIPLLLRPIHKVKVEHTIRVQGGGFVGLLITTSEPPPKTSASSLIFYPPNARFMESQPDGATLIVVGTVSGDLEIVTNKTTKTISPKRLESPSGTTFDLIYNVTENRFICNVKVYDRQEFPFCDVSPAVRFVDDESKHHYKIYWCNTLFADGTSFTWEKLL